MGGKRKKRRAHRKRHQAPRQTAGTPSRRLPPWSLFVLLGFLLVSGYLVYPTLKRLVHPVVRNADDVLDLASPFPPLKRAASSEPAVRFEDFVGSRVCAECHKEEYRVWKSSTHGKAGGLPGQVPIIAAFNRSVLRYRDATVSPVRKNDSTLVFIVSYPNGKQKEYPVAAVVGGGHMYGGGTQSFFTQFSDGTLRFLPFDYSRTSKTWFSQRRKDYHWIPVDETLALSELSEWPPHRVLGTEKSFMNCQNCHGSQIRLRFDETIKKFRTEFRSLSINCESCHGPGRRHVELMRQDTTGTREDIGMKSLAVLSKDESLQICFQCHALKDVLKEDYLPGMPVEHAFSFKSPMLAKNPYFPDGRIREFGYQQNHLFSDCYLNGSMTCVDCHDPHTQEYRDIWGTPLQGKFDDGQCTACHPSKTVNVKQHTRHRPDSPGSRCVACHMPFLQHPGIGDRIRFARSDHTIPIPRPEFDQSLGLDNACSQCHRKWPVDSLQAIVNQWYGDLKPHKEAVTALLDAERYRNRVEAAKRLLTIDAAHPMARYAGLVYFIREYLRPDMDHLEPEIIMRLKALAGSSDLDIRAMAMMALHLAAGERKEIIAFLKKNLAAAGEEEAAIRMRWAMAVDYLGTQYAQQGETSMAIRAHRKALQIRPDDVVAWINLGNVYGNRKEYDKAIQVFQKATQLEPSNALAWTNLGLALAMKGQITQAVAAYQQAIAVRPYEANAYILLSQAFLHQGDTFMAREVLRTGRKYVPENETIEKMLEGMEAGLTEPQ